MRRLHPKVLVLRRTGALLLPQPAAAKNRWCVGSPAPARRCALGSIRRSWAGFGVATGRCPAR